MSVLINIEMPDNCINCRFCDIDLSSPTTFYVHCTATDKKILKCDYDDFEEAYQVLKSGRQERCPLVEVPDGHWINEPGKIPKCSECGRYSDDADTGDTKYCPFCGARMDKE